MENLSRAEAPCLNTSAYPEEVSESKSVVSPQGLLWALIALVLYVIYSQQPDKGTTLGIVQITLIISCAVLAVVKFFIGDHKLTYTPTGSIIVREERYYNITLESDIRQCLHEGNTSRLRALKTDDSGGLLIETLTSKDRAFTAVRMQKYCPEGYRPETQWVVMSRAF